VICTSCGAAIAVISQFDPGVVARELMVLAKEQFATIDSRLSNIEAQLADIRNQV